MQDGCKGLRGFLHGIKWFMFYGRLNHLQNLSLGDGIWLRARSQMSSRYTILDLSWDGLWTFFLGSHNIMVTALGSCVELLST
jgi:hypothetical protein